MTFENNFKEHSKKYIFSNNQILSKQREDIFKKISANKFEKRNNESLKNITFSDLSFFKYFHEPSNERTNVNILNNDKYEVQIINGTCKNYEDKNIEIRNIKESDLLILAEQYNEDHDDLIIDFNKIFLNSGFFFNVKSNNKIQIKLIYKTDENNTIFQNNFFNFSKNCNVLLEDEYNFSDNTTNNINYNIQAHEGSSIKHNIFQNFSNTNKLYLSSNIVCEKKSSFKQNTYNFAKGLVRNFHNVKLNGEFSYASLEGCFFLKDKNISSNKTYITHNAENCQSNQTYKGILNDDSRANYYSNTYVAKDAQKTEGYQLSKGILLTDNCYFFSKPELRIFADDVKCSHGSTIGPVDESALYYLRSRGINKKIAMKMIISSFIEEDLKNLDDNTSEKISLSLSEYLKSIV